MNYLKEESSSKMYFMECYARKDYIITITNSKWSQYVPVLSQNPSDRFRSSDVVNRALDSQSTCFWVQNHWVNQSSTQPSSLWGQSNKWVPGIPKDLVVESKLSPRCGSAALKQLNLTHKKGQ